MELLSHPALHNTQSPRCLTLSQLWGAKFVTLSESLTQGVSDRSKSLANRIFSSFLGKEAKVSSSLLHLAGIGAMFLERVLYVSISSSRHVA